MTAANDLKVAVDQAVAHADLVQADLANVKAKADIVEAKADELAAAYADYRAALDMMALPPG